MIAVPTRSPATTMATWVFRRKKFPMPIRKGKRFRPVQTRIPRTTKPTRASSTIPGSTAMGSRTRGPEGLQDQAVAHQDDALRRIPHRGVMGHEDERQVPLVVQPLHHVEDSGGTVVPASSCMKHLHPG